MENVYSAYTRVLNFRQILREYTIAVSQNWNLWIPRKGSVLGKSRGEKEISRWWNGLRGEHRIFYNPRPIFSSQFRYSSSAISVSKDRNTALTAQKSQWYQWDITGRSYCDQSQPGYSVNDHVTFVTVTHPLWDSSLREVGGIFPCDSFVIYHFVIVVMSHRLHTVTKSSQCKIRTISQLFIPSSRPRRITAISQWHHNHISDLCNRHKTFPFLSHGC